jgi:hypothetical protein
MLQILTVVVFMAGLAAQRPAAPECRAESGRRSERLQGAIKRGDEFARTTPAGWILRLRPQPEGWLLQVTTTGREGEDLTRLTPPWHSVPNPREIDGWHFRNSDNTGPNDGSVNAPREVRDFIFSPAVGRSIDYNGSATSGGDVDAVRAFGQGWLFIEKYALTPAVRGGRASFDAMEFSVCLTWPAATTSQPTPR